LTQAGERLTIQATGMGGPSAAIVLADLAELGVRRAVRVGSCVAVDPAWEPGQLLLVSKALAAERASLPDPDLSGGLKRELGGAVRTSAIASLDRPLSESVKTPAQISAADMQTATVLSLAQTLGIAAASVLIIEESASGEQIDERAFEQAAKRAGSAAVAVLSS
jgi:uridine phosphorylase